MIGSCHCLSGFWIDEDPETPFVGRVEAVGGCCAAGEVAGLRVVEGDLGDGLGGRGCGVGWRGEGLDLGEVRVVRMVG